MINNYEALPIDKQFLFTKILILNFFKKGDFMKIVT